MPRPWEWEILKQVLQVPSVPLLMNNITYSVDSVSYGTYANTTTITLANNVVLDTGTEISPLLLSINRNIIDNQNVSIYTIN